MRIDIDSCEEILITITRNKTRSLLTAFGVFWGIFMLIVLLGAGTGLGRMFRAQLGGTATNAIFIMSDRTSVPYEGMPTGRSWELDWDDLEALRKLPRIEYISAICWGNQRNMSHQDHKGEFGLMGYSPDMQQIAISLITTYQINTASGRIVPCNNCHMFNTAATVAKENKIASLRRC